METNRRSMPALARHAFLPFVLALFLGLSFWLSAHASAATLVVDRVDDDTVSGCSGAANDCTLRGAITAANATAGADVIIFSSLFESAQTISLDTVLPAMMEAVTVTGPGAKLLQVKATTPRSTNFYNFTINFGVSATFSGLTISDGLVGITNFGGGTLTVSDCAFTGTANGVYNTGANTTSIVSGSTFSGNSSAFVFSQGAGTGTLTNCTFNNNSSHAILVANSNAQNVTVTNCTVNGNGTGIYNGGTPAVVIKNTIVAGNTTDFLGNWDGGTDTLYNIVTGDPKLGPLQDNGGPTPTMALLSDSPALNKGEDEVAPTTDQRGVLRPQRGQSDIGAFELEAAQSLVVTTTEDENDGTSSAETGAGTSLREAIIYANSNADSSTITFNLVGDGPFTINLAEVLPALSTSLNIHNGSGKQVIVRRDTGGDYRIFKVSNGTKAGPTVDIRAVTIANGKSNSGDFSGNGGAVLNDYGVLSFKDCTFSGNATSEFGYGGAIYNNGFEGTSALTINSCTFTSNSAYGGGALSNHGVNGTATLSATNSTFSGNAATFRGGGIFANAVNNGTSTLTVRNCTLSGNTAGESGSGIFNLANDGNAALTIGSTILDSGSGSNINNSSGTVLSQGYNLSSGADGGDGGTVPGGLLNSTGDKRNTDPKLAALANNGGPTQTMALLAGSPAINAGTSTGSPTTDQRGMPRVGQVDIGAYEFQKIESLVVTTTADENDGTSDANEGTGTSLREAIAFANANTDSSVITFNLPNAGPHTIQLSSRLPHLTTTLKINNTSGESITVRGEGEADQYGIFLNARENTAEITNLTITNGFSLVGGGISSYGDLTLKNCTVSGNRAVLLSGGGIYNREANLYLINCTISGNTADESGGGIFNDVEGNLSLVNCTVSGNSAGRGSGIFNHNNATTVLRNTILNQSGGNLINNVGTITSNGYNLSSDDASAFLNAAGDQNSTDSMLSALADNGGPTFTMALLTGSPAINAGTSTGAPTTDQRGYSRVGQVDIGAYEDQTRPPNTSPTLNTLDAFLKIDEDTVLTFSTGILDARFSDSDGDTLQKVKILSLPVNGVLLLAGNAVSVNQEITRDDFDELTYSPNSNYYGSDSFNWNGSDGTEYAAQGATIKILINSVNDAPVLSPIGNLTAVAGTPFTFKATATDVDGYNLQFTTIGAPAGSEMKPQRGEFLWNVPAHSKGVHLYTFIVKVTDRGEPARSDEEQITVRVVSGVLFSVTPQYLSGWARLVYRLENGTNKAISSIKVTGNVLGPVDTLNASAGLKSIKIINPSTSMYGITWSGFSLNPGQNATLTIDIPNVPSNREITNSWKAVWNSGSASTGNVRTP